MARESDKVSKWQKAHFFEFFFIEIPQNIFGSGCGNKKCLGMMSKHFMFSVQKIFSLKFFDDGPRILWLFKKSKSADLA